MAADLNQLIPEFKADVELLLQNCLKRGIEMRPNEGLRHPLVQAQYWRRSRTREEIEKKIFELKHVGANYLAYCLESVGPQHGNYVTGVIPGFSWHQWGEALDCYWVVRGKAVWDLKTVINGLNGYMIYADEAIKLGLEAGLFWKNLVDAPHVQMRKTSNPGKIYSISDIERTMQQRFPI